jgi:hypothetical protein
MGFLMPVIFWSSSDFENKLESRKGGDGDGRANREQTRKAIAGGVSFSSIDIYLENEFR